MKGVVLVLIVGTGVVGPLPAVSAPHYGAYSARGIGNATCSRWIEWRKERGPDTISAESWVMGYVTARDEVAFDADKGSGPDVSYILGAATNNDALNGWIDTFCATHPSYNLAQASHELVKALEARAP